MSGNKILVVNGYSYAAAIAGLGAVTFDVNEFYSKPEDFKLVMFTGGEDVSPELYGDTSPRRVCQNSWKRDMEELDIFNSAIKHGIKMTGICRGSQFLNVMSGGKMIHHLNNHGGVTHGFVSPIYREVLLVNSLHHQMMIPSEEGIVIGWAERKLATIYLGNTDEVTAWDDVEVEAIFYPKTLCCGVQYHPEIMKKESDGYRFFHEMIADFLMMTAKQFSRIYTANEKTHQAYR